jgi:REP element-mobilizing transposase RayT
MVIRGEPAIYHVISRTALAGFVLGDEEKDFLLDLIKRLSSVYFAEVLGFSLMGDHFHLLVRMHPDEEFPNREVQRRYRRYHGTGSKRTASRDQIPGLREKWASLSEYVREIKQGFTRWYNKRSGRRGFFWAERFKSVIVDRGEPLVSCLAYIDLNPVRAGLVKRPDEYRWCSLGYHALSGNRDEFLSLDFGLPAFESMDDAERLQSYRGFVYEVGALTSEPPGDPVAAGEQPGNEPADTSRYLNRTRYFTDSGVIGSKEFVSSCYRRFEHHFTCRHEKKPQRIGGLEGVYSLKRLRSGP